MINITMKIIFITKRVTRKLWKISAGRKIITKIAKVINYIKVGEIWQKVKRQKYIKR